MKKFTAFLAIAAAFSSISVAQVAVSGAPDASWVPTTTVTPMSGGAVEYKTYIPKWSLDLLSVSASVGYESKYMFRGEKLAGNSIQSGVDIAYPFYGIDVYAGVWNNSPVESKNNDELNEIDFYAGANYYYGAFRLDIGTIYYWNPEGGQAFRDFSNMEVYGGVTLDTASVFYGYNLNPAIYYYYNWDLEQHVAEFSMTYNAEIGRILINDSRLTLPVSAYVGYLVADKKANKDFRAGSREAEYAYYGVSADLAFAIREYCTISAGARWGQRFEEQKNTKYILDDHKSNFWFGAKVHFGF